MQDQHRPSFRDCPLQPALQSAGWTLLLLLLLLAEWQCDEPPRQCFTARPDGMLQSHGIMQRRVQAPHRMEWHRGEHEAHSVLTSGCPLVVPKPRDSLKSARQRGIPDGTIPDRVGEPG
jgi:hypothetical protein